MTLKGAQREMRAIGIVLTHFDGEYRVNLRGGTEATACYETDLESAVDTGRAMARLATRTSNDTK